MKLHFTSLAVLVFVLILSHKIFSSSISFVNPINGGVVTSLYSETQIALNLQYHVNSPGSYYVKLFPTPYGTQQSNQGNGISQWWYLSPGTYTWRLELWEYDLLGDAFKAAEQTITFYVKHTFIVKNNFVYGIINVDGVQRNSPYQLYRFTSNTVTGGAIDQLYQGYNRIWNSSGTNNSDWARQRKLGAYFSNLSQSRNYPYTLVSDDNGASLIANLRKICKPNFQNSFVGVGNGGVINVNSVQYNSPTAQFDVVEQNPITGAAQYQVINGIEYTFSQWSDGSTNATKTFNPSSTTTYTAYFTGKPSTANRNLHTGTSYGQPIVLYWNEHPNTNVTQYQIWRRVKHNGVVGPDVLLSTKNRETTSYTDNEYALTNGYTDDLLWYDVRPYYSTENSYANANWLAVYGEEFAKPAYQNLFQTTNLENSLSNFPNPFNPVTNINFSIKEAGLVSIRVYDLTGQKVAELVNEEKEVGGYSITFDASHLPSGLYIYTINAKNFSQTRKMLLMK